MTLFSPKRSLGKPKASHFMLGSFTIGTTCPFCWPLHGLYLMPCLAKMRFGKVEIVILSRLGYWKNVSELPTIFTVITMMRITI